MMVEAYEAGRMTRLTEPAHSVLATTPDAFAALLTAQRAVSA